MADTSASTSALGRPRKPSSSGQVFSSCAMPSASSRLRPPWGGSRRIVVSLNSSAVTPPMPSRIAVPSASRCMPRISSVPPPTISCTRKRCGRTPAFASTSAAIAASRAPIDSGARLTATPPTSVLCVICDDRIFSTTRPPSSRAAASASTGEATTRSRAHGTPKRAKSCLAWASSSEPAGKSSTATAASATGASTGAWKRPTFSIAASATVQLSAAAKAGTPALREQCADLRRMRAHVGDHGLVRVRQALLDGAGHQLGHRQAGRADDDRQRVVARTLQQHVDRTAQQVGLQAGERDVDRVAVEHRVIAGLQRAQRLGGGRIGRGRVEAGHAEIVGDQRAGAAGGREDGDAVAAQLAAGGERGRECRAGRRRSARGSRRPA